MIAGHLQEKYGCFYIVLSYRDDQGKRHTPWFPTRLPVKGNKKRAEAMLLEMRKTYVPPVSSTENPPVDPQTGLVFADFLQQWLCVAHFQSPHCFEGTHRPAIAKGELCNLAFLTEVSIDTMFFNGDMKHLAGTGAIDVASASEYLHPPLFSGQPCNYAGFDC